MQALVNDAKLPAIIALNANLENVFDLDGAKALSPPIWIPIEATFAKPQSAYVLIDIERSFEFKKKFH